MSPPIFFTIIMVLTSYLSITAQVIFPKNLDAAEAGFGSSLKIQDEQLLVGVPSFNRVEIHKWNGESFELDQLVHAPYHAEFGTTTAISDEFLVVQGSFKSVFEEFGKVVFIYEKDEDGKWQFAQRVEGKSEEDITYGDNLEIYRNNVIIVNPRSGEAYNSGTIDVLTKGSNGLWDKRTLSPENPTPWLFFGVSISVHDHVLAVGVPKYVVNGVVQGGVNLYDMDNEFSLMETVSPSSLIKESSFGIDVNLTDSELIVSSYGKSEPDQYVGSVYILTHNGQDWEIAQILEPSNSAKNTFFGTHVEKTANYLAISSPNYDEFGKSKDFIPSVFIFAKGSDG